MCRRARIPALETAPGLGLTRLPEVGVWRYAASRERATSGFLGRPQHLGDPPRAAPLWLAMGLKPGVPFFRFPVPPRVLRM